jgi:hypothetical protein
MKNTITVVRRSVTSLVFTLLATFEGVQLAVAETVVLDSAAPTVGQPVLFAPAEAPPAPDPAAKAEEKDAEKEEEEEEEKIDPTIRPLQYFKDEFVASCCDEHSWLKDLQLNGYLDQTFTYNFNHPDNPNNTYRVYDRKHAQYMLNMLQLYALKDPTKESRWGFGAKISTGMDTDVNSPFNEDNTDKFDVQELYGSYLFDIGENGMLVKAGRFATLVGAEVVEQKDNWNISRSYLFGWGPFFHTGVRANYKINDIYDFTFGVNRGWDTSRYDNNDALSYEARLGTVCSDKLSMGTTVVFGPENEDNDGDNRALLDYVVTYKFTKKLTGMLNATVGQDEAGEGDGGTGTAHWHGLAAYLKYDCNDKLSYAWRGELVQDKDGNRTGTPQAILANTATAQYKFRENLIGRLEFRNDHSNKSVFTKETGFSGSQNTIAASVMVTF